jgi:hypothetical protein
LRRIAIAAGGAPFLILRACRFRSTRRCLLWSAAFDASGADREGQARARI